MNKYTFVSIIIAIIGLDTNAYSIRKQTSFSLKSYMSSDPNKILQDELNLAIGSSDELLDCDPIFSTFSQSKTFKDIFWQKKPFLFESKHPNLVEAFTMKDVEFAVESDFLEAGRGTFSESGGGWKMAAVSTVNFVYFIILIQ